MKVLLLGGGLQALSFGESLFQREGCEVSVVSNSYDIKRCRFFAKVYGMDNENYDERLRQILSEEHYDIIVPMVDVPVAFLSKRKDFLEETYGVKCAVESESMLAVMADKSEFMKFCRQNGYPHPTTEKLSASNLEDAASIVGFPSLIKPDYSIGARGITRVDSVEELRTQYPKVAQQYGSCTLQEFIDNPDYYYNVMMYRDSRGRCDNYAVIKILRKYPIAAGSSSCCVSVNDDDLVSLCKDVLDRKGWVGMADFDILQRKDTGEYKIIEINPRVPASLRAAYVSGVNFPDIIVSDLSEHTVNRHDYKPGKTLRYLGIDIMWMLKSPNRFHASPSWFRFVGKDVYYQDIIKSAPSTWYSWLITGLSKFIHPNSTVH